MKKILLIGLLLTSACSSNNISSKISSSSDITSTSTFNELSNSEVFANSSSTSEISSSYTSSSEVSSSDTQKEELNIYEEALISKQTYLHSIGNIFEAWNHYSGKGVNLAIIDTGFDINHPDFKNSEGEDLISPLSASFKLINNNVEVLVGKENVGIKDGDSHGTFVSSIASSRLNKIGTLGIAYDANLMFLKVDKKPKSIARAFKYAADNGAKVISISIGSYADYEGDLINDGSDLTTVFNDATSYAYDKGVCIISAAGNGGSSLREYEFTYPARSSHVISVGGLKYNEDDVIWEYSTHNKSKSSSSVDIYAPSNKMVGAAYLDNKSTYGTNWDGTSFAAPIVAGAACLYFEKYPNKTNKDFYSDLISSGSKMHGYDKTGDLKLDITKLLDLDITKEVNINFEASSWWLSDNARTYMYIWNSRTKEELASWPGVAYAPNYKIRLDAYDSVIFTRYSMDGKDDYNARTINLNLSLFDNIKTYSIKNNSPLWYSESGPVEGVFVSL